MLHSRRSRSPTDMNSSHNNNNNSNSNKRRSERGRGLKESRTKRTGGRRRRRRSGRSGRSGSDSSSSNGNGNGNRSQRQENDGEEDEADVDIEDDDASLCIICTDPDLNPPLVTKDNLEEMFRVEELSSNAAEAAESVAMKLHEVNTLSLQSTTLQSQATDSNSNDHTNINSQSNSSPLAVKASTSTQTQAQNQNQSQPLSSPSPSSSSSSFFSSLSSSFSESLRVVRSAGFAQSLNSQSGALKNGVSSAQPSASNGNTPSTAVYSTSSSPQPPPLDLLSPHIGINAQSSAQYHFSPRACILQLKSAALCDEWVPLIQQLRRCFPSCFICVVCPDADVSPEMRKKITSTTVPMGANMFTADQTSMFSALNIVANEGTDGGALTCPYCKLGGLSEDELWLHGPLFHIGVPNTMEITCPICSKNCEPHGRSKPFQVHLRNQHGPCARGIVAPEGMHRADQLFAFSLVYCVRSDGCVLLVDEFASVGFWLPGGKVDPGESLTDAALRETREEAGLEVQLTGVLGIEHSGKRGYTRLRVIFMAKPVDEKDPLKSLPDYESAGASWVNPSSILNRDIQLRGLEPYMWCKYLKEGGTVHPMSLLQTSGLGD